MLDKNKDGRVSATELTSKAEMAFKVDQIDSFKRFITTLRIVANKNLVMLLTNYFFQSLDKDHDGFITKEEFARIHKTMSPKQVVRVKTNKKLKSCRVKYSFVNTSSYTEHNKDKIKMTYVFA